MWNERHVQILNDGQNAKVFKEKVGGAKTDRAELAKLLRRIEPGDVLIVPQLLRPRRERPRGHRAAEPPRRR